MAFELDEFLQLQQGGRSQGEILTALKEHGLTIVEAIKASRSLFGIGLGEAKSIVTSHPSWSETAQAARPFQDALIRTFAMSTGGQDTVMKAPADLPVADVVLRVFGRHWPACLFQEEGEASYHVLDDQLLWLSLTDSAEFFVYRDAEAARQWDEEGFDASDPNSMLYFIVSPSDQAGRRPREVTLVCGELDEEMLRLIEELKSGFEYYAAAPAIKEAA
jgi:hypothetical protein